MAESTTRTTPSDDVVREILLRLDVATLFRCAATCKRWRRLVSKWPPSLVGFFFAKRCLGTRLPGMFPTDSASSQLVFVPLPGSSLLGTSPRAVSSFIHADDAAAVAVVDRASPLATRGGLLLVRLPPRDGDLKQRNTFSLAPVFNPIVRLAVCNLLAGTWDVLPELNCQSRFDSSDSYGRDIIPSIAADGSPAFKVLMIGADKDRAQYNLHTFVSGEASWRAPTKCFDMMELQIWSMENAEAVMCGGYAHWLFASESNHFHVLNVDTETGHVSLTKLVCPTKDGFRRMNTGDLKYDCGIAAANRQRLRDLLGADHLVTSSNGTSLSLCAYRGGRLEIWTQHSEDRHKSGDGDAVWFLTKEIDHKLTQLIQQLEKPYCIWSGERSDIMIITEHYQRDRLHIAHLDTGTLEEATEQFPDHARNGMIPMEIDWPTYFMARLGGS